MNAKELLHLHKPCSGSKSSRVKVSVVCKHLQMQILYLFLLLSCQQGETSVSPSFSVCWTLLETMAKYTNKINRKCPSRRNCCNYNNCLKIDSSLHHVILTFMFCWLGTLKPQAYTLNFTVNYFSKVIVTFMLGDGNSTTICEWLEVTVHPNAYGSC